MDLDSALDSLATQFGDIKTKKSSKTKAQRDRAMLGMGDMMDALLEDVSFAQNPFRRTGMTSTRRHSVKARVHTRKKDRMRMKNRARVKGRKRRSPLSGTRKRRRDYVKRRRMRGKK